MSAYHFKYFQNIQFKNYGIAPTPPDLPTLKAYPTPGVGGRFEFFSLKWRERMNLKVPGAILPLGCAILSTRAITVRGGWYNPPLGELGLTNPSDLPTLKVTLPPGEVVVSIFFTKMRGKDELKGTRSRFWAPGRLLQPLFREPGLINKSFKHYNIANK